MLDGKKVLAVIPARAGSKRCPDKNLRDFRGKPLVVWALQHAHESKLVDEIVVSSDDVYLLRLCQTAAKVHHRSDELANDTAINEDVLRAVLAECPDYEWVILLQPTSPLRTAHDIDRTLLEAKYGGFDAACTYSESGKKNGAVYACSAQWLRDGKDFTHYYADPYFMPEERSLDIDYPEQFQ